MNDALLKKLIDFGLSDKEAKVYLALLTLETATAFEIARQAGINRSSTYVVLESLKKQGLVGVSDDKKIRQYVAASPDTLLHTAETTAKKQTEIKEGIESIVPELKVLHKGAKRRPVVKIFEGKSSAREVYWDILSTNAKDLRTFANPVNIFKRVPDFADQDQARGKRGIKMYAINPATKEIIDLYKHLQPHEPYEVALIPEERFHFSSDVGIYADRVAFTSPKDDFGIVIKSKEIADILKSSFDLAWEEAKRLDKKIRKRLN